MGSLFSRKEELVDINRAKRCEYGYELSLELDLSEHHFAHSEKSDCACDGLAHEIIVNIDLADHNLHSDDDCLFPDLSNRALQNLHEQAHKRGSLYVENCLEKSCRDILGELY